MKAVTRFSETPLEVRVKGVTETRAVTVKPAAKAETPEDRETRGQLNL
jgi:hypothetical protein